MKVRIAEVLKAFNGTPHKDFVDGRTTENDLTLKTAIVNSLTAIYNDEKPNGEESFKRGQLAHRVYKTEHELDLSAENIADIKRLIGKYYGPAIVFAAWTILEGGTEKPK
jgi:hypothetical protein